MVNAQFRHPFAEHWGDGTTSSSDGQNFPPAARPRAPATSTRNTGAAQGGRSTPTFLTSTRHFTPRS
ncbi:Tn3 family transposase [Klebsiella pneumoniae]|uniref:Tn3 family transposase n=1 Tax=Klebsiella pneumoniae TaxID=573 RepID=UPI002265ECF4|nr:Tn3 family transposase [Klebsiella pneumoniae]